MATIPTVPFDSSRVTEEIRTDLLANIVATKELGATYLETIYPAAVQSVLHGRDVGALASAILAIGLPKMTKRRAGEIAQALHNKSSALMNRDQQQGLGIKHALWVYSGAPCHGGNPTQDDKQRDAAHRRADGNKYEVAKGMLLDGHRTWPGREEGCKCLSRSVIPGFR